jgi:hypothetical protein
LKDEVDEVAAVVATDEVISQIASIVSNSTFSKNNLLLLLSPSVAAEAFCMINEGSNCATLVLAPIGVGTKAVAMEEGDMLVLVMTVAIANAAKLLVPEVRLYLLVMDLFCLLVLVLLVVAVYAEAGAQRWWTQRVVVLFVRPI